MNKTRDYNAFYSNEQISEWTTLFSRKIKNAQVEIIPVGDIIYLRLGYLGHGAQIRLNHRYLDMDEYVSRMADGAVHTLSRAFFLGMNT